MEDIQAVMMRLLREHEATQLQAGVQKCISVNILNSASPQVTAVALDHPNRAANISVMCSNTGSWAQAVSCKESLRKSVPDWCRKSFDLTNILVR